MVEPAGYEPTIADIAVALREARQGVGRPPHFTVVDGKQPDDNWGSGATPRNNESAGLLGHFAAPDHQNENGSTEIGRLRDDEIERLLTENARLHERIFFLLKTIDGMRGGDTEPAAWRAPAETDRDAILGGLRAAIEAELRPFLVIVLRLLEKWRAGTPGKADAGFTAQPAGGNTRRSEADAAPTPVQVAAVPIGTSR
jgi:hypothetical protein